MLTRRGDNYLIVPMARYARLRQVAALLTSIVSSLRSLTLDITLFPSSCHQDDAGNSLLADPGSMAMEMTNVNEETYCWHTSKFAAIKVYRADDFEA